MYNVFYILYITLATLIWKFVSKIDCFNWLWKLHVHLTKLKRQLLKIKLCSKLASFVSRFPSLHLKFSQFLNPHLAHLNSELRRSQHKKWKCYLPSKKFHRCCSFSGMKNTNSSLLYVTSIVLIIYINRDSRGK